MTSPSPQNISKKALWAGRILSTIAVLMLGFSGVVKLMKPDAVLQEFNRLGYPEGVIIGIGILELSCTLIYVMPRTSVFGAILLAAYLGGATATHVRINDPFYGPVIFGVLAWVGLYLREPRLRALVPLRKE